MDKYFCNPCGYTYDPEKGDPEHGIKPGTAFEDIPDDWCCPICGVTKDMFMRVIQQKLLKETILYVRHEGAMRTTHCSFVFISKIDTFPWNNVLSQAQILLYNKTNEAKGDWEKVFLVSPLALT